MPHSELLGSSPFGCIPQHEWTTGAVYYVDGATGNDRYVGTDPSSPKLTIKSALDNCVANKGDIVYVMPGEYTLSTPLQMATAGVSLIGIGSGDTRPILYQDVDGSEVTISGDNTRFSNFIFDWNASSPATTTRCVRLNTTTACTVDHITIKPHATSQFTDLILVFSAGADCVIANCDLYSLEASSSSTRGIGLTSTSADRLQIVGNRIHGFFASSAVDGSGAQGEILLFDNYIHNGSSTAGDTPVDLADTTTGICAWNRLSGGLALASNFDPGNTHNIENYVVDAVNVHGVVVPVTAST